MPVNQRYAEYIADQREFHDQVITEDWGSYFSEEWDQTRKYEVECLFKVVQATRILDIGCGCGFHDREMGNYPFVEKVDAFDFSPESIVKAEEHYSHAKVRRWVGSFRDTKLEPIYDLVVSFEVFEHLNDPEVYLERMRDCVRPGGYAAIVMPNRLRLPNALRVLTFRPPRKMSVMHWHEYTRSEIKRLGRLQGLKHLATFGYGLEGPFIRGLSHAMRLKLGRLLPWVAQGMGVVFQLEQSI